MELLGANAIVQCESGSEHCYVTVVSEMHFTSPADAFIGTLQKWKMQLSGYGVNGESIL